MPQNQYKCETCGATFNTKDKLNEHHRTMHSQFRCEDCGQTFASEADLEMHIRSAHPQQERHPLR